MHSLEHEASQGLADSLSNVAGAEITSTERHAAFMLMCTMPDSATLQDFIVAADIGRIKQAGLPDSTGRNLMPLVSRLKDRSTAANRTSRLLASAT